MKTTSGDSTYRYVTEGGTPKQVNDMSEVLGVLIDTKEGKETMANVLEQHDIHP